MNDNIVFIKAPLEYINQKNLGGIFLNIDQEKAFDRVSHNYLNLVMKKFGFGKNFQKWIKILYTNIESSILVNGHLSTIIYILRSIRQGCPIAPLLYICVMETLLIKIRSNSLIHGIKSPTSNEKLLLSAFADDTGFFIEGVQSAEKIIASFEFFGKASGSRINLEKTEGMWLGKEKNNNAKPLSIKWVKETKSLGYIFGYTDTQSLNWVRCIDKFRNDILKHVNRNTTILGKTSILNYIGYSKLWCKSIHSIIPDVKCKRINGSEMDIKKTFNDLSQGFLWGFNLKSNGMELDLCNPKNPQIGKNTLWLKKEHGGTNLIDYLNKMKSFRILFVYKFLKNENKNWMNILRYWYDINLLSITNRRINNAVPHAQSMEDIPLFFRQCLIEFKEYHSKHNWNMTRDINSKIIYENLMSEKNHIPAAIVRYPEMKNYLHKLPNYYFLDPYLREFLFKLYHCRLVFKRYRLNINDMINFGQKCLLCNNAIDTPNHLFMNCEIGELVRVKRDNLIYLYKNQILNLDMNAKVFSYARNDNLDTVIQYIITVSNYCIYRIKMKKFYDINYFVKREDPVYMLINRIKSRIICDHRRFQIEKFKNIWDPNNLQLLFNYNIDKINYWNF